FQGTPSDEAWILPNGEPVEPAGPRRTDMVLVWPEVENELMDEGRIRSLWPGCKELRRLGENLFLVSGIELADRGSAVKLDVPPDAKGCPREAARRMLAAARQARDPRSEAAALAELGIMSLQQGKKRVALGMLEKAAALIHELGDPLQESDVL